LDALTGQSAAREPIEAALSEIGGSKESPLSLRIHDSSRFEWSVSLPLPAERKLAYEISVQLEIPTSAAARQVPWESLQTFTRLDGPADVARSQDVTVDALRRGAVTLTQMLRRAGEGFARHCGAVAGEPGAAAAFEGGEKSFLLIWLDAALRAVRETREKLIKGAREEAPLIARERELIDEFVSIRLLDMLAEAQRALGEVGKSAAPSVEEAIGRVQARIDEALGDEFAYRQQRGFLCADPLSPEDLERYLGRAARLKKHFEEVLFLERETHQLDERVQQWMATLGALLGGIVAFIAIQVALSVRRPAPLEVGSGLALLALIAGLGYAARHRMQAWGGSWLAGKVYRFHAQRVSRCRVPSRRLPTRDVLVEAREWCHQATSSRPDAVNPEAGASLPITQVRYRHKGVVLPRKELSAAGVQRVRHIFRYDLSPLFSRLDDDLKPVPVLDDARVRFVATPRTYRVPVDVRVGFGGEQYEEKAEIVVDKNGLRRIMRIARRLPTDLAS
jgi:hypothetical protein